MRGSSTRSFLFAPPNILRATIRQSTTAPLLCDTGAQDDRYKHAMIRDYSSGRRLVYSSTHILRDGVSEQGRIPSTSDVLYIWIHASPAEQRGRHACDAVSRVGVISSGILQMRHCKV